MTRAWRGPSKWPCSSAVSSLCSIWLLPSNTHTHKFSSLLPLFQICGDWNDKKKKVHKLNSIVHFAYARFTILIILLLPHHHQCIASVYSISICRGGPFSTTEYGICWTPQVWPPAPPWTSYCALPTPAPPCCSCEGHFPPPCMTFFWIPQVWPACSSMNQL